MSSMHSNSCPSGAMLSKLPARSSTLMQSRLLSTILSEALGFEKGVSRSFREAPIFIGVFTFLIAVGAAIAIIPDLPLIRVLLVTQVINGLLLPVILIAVLRLVNSRDVMGTHVNGWIYNMAAWLTTIIVTLLSILYIVTTLFPGLLRF